MKARIKKRISILLLLTLPFFVTFQSCDPNTVDDVINQVVSILSQTGWLEDKENMDDIPEDITPLNDDTGNLPASYSLESKFPPIGDQGQYGTCVVWSVGYNLKTSLNAIEKGWSSTDLSKTSNQTSPKDLWLNIPTDKKGTNCDGTNFEPALDALISNGAATLSDVPYANMGNCTGTKVGKPDNKLTNYRKIASETDGLNVTNFKNYLAAGRPISIGAKLGDRFMTWKNSSIISSDTYNNPGMQHAYHAMVLVGYDDAKHAFRVRNSWGPSWGDNGSIWVDYDFFCNSFCFAAFVAQNVNSVSTSGGSIGSGSLSNGYDLLAYSAVDTKLTNNPDHNREFTYEVYNSGNKTITPDQKWTILYMYYNATDANDYQIIFDDYYTTEFGAGDDSNPNSKSLAGGWWNNYSVAPGKKVGEEQYPDGFVISYNMPKITGKYYLVVMADGYDKISEVNEDNNFYFISAEGGKPLEFQNGEILNMPTAAQQLAKKSLKQPALFANVPTQTLVKPGNLNAYTPMELKTMLLHDKKTGKLDAKIKAFKMMNANKAMIKTKKK